MGPVSCKCGPPPMRPKTSGDAPTDDLFRLRLEQMIDSRHELVRLADLIDWSRFDAGFDGLFHPSRGAPAVPTRMIAGLHYAQATPSPSPTRTSFDAGSRTPTGNTSAARAAKVLSEGQTRGRDERDPGRRRA